MMHRTLRGKMVDISLYAQEHQNQVALGNAAMNAAGDKIGPGGKVIKTRAEIDAEYNQSNPRSVKRVALKDLEKELMTPAEAVAQVKKAQEAKQAVEANKTPVAKQRRIKEEE